MVELIRYGYTVIFVGVLIALGGFVGSYLGLFHVTKVLAYCQGEYPEGEDVTKEFIHNATSPFEQINTIQLEAGGRQFAAAGGAVSDMDVYVYNPSTQEWEFLKTWETGGNTDIFITHKDENFPPNDGCRGGYWEGDCWVCPDTWDINKIEDYPTCFPGDEEYALSVNSKYCPTEYWNFTSDYLDEDSNFVVKSIQHSYWDKNQGWALYVDTRFGDTITFFGTEEELNGDNETNGGPSGGGGVVTKTESKGYKIDALPCEYKLGNLVITCMALLVIIGGILISIIGATMVWKKL